MVQENASTTLLDLSLEDSNWAVINGVNTMKLLVYTLRMGHGSGGDHHLVLCFLFFFFFF